uniref:Uncharacterized protein n=1 Tax=Peronospora matthiolae TaxID=2874970 RepID=A0AAV1V2E9_9STRA
MRTYPKFYVGRLRPYYQYEPVSRGEEHLRGQGPRPPSSGPVSTSQSGLLAKRPAHAVERCIDELQPAHHEENESNVRSQVVRTQKRHDGLNGRALSNCNYPLQDPQAHNAESVHEPDHLATVPLHVLAPEHQGGSDTRAGSGVPAATTSFGGLKRWSTLSGGAYFEPPRREWRPDELPRLLAWLSNDLSIWGPHAQLIFDFLGLVD